MVKILVVEDDRDLNRFVSLTLRNYGYDVTTAFNGSEGIKCAQETKFDLILTDIMMPEKNGYDLAEEIRLTDNKTPIIFMTAKEDKSSQMLAYGIGIDDYVTKPFDIDLLRLKIEAILRRAKIESKKQSR